MKIFANFWNQWRKPDGWFCSGASIVAIRPLWRFNKKTNFYSVGVILELLGFRLTVEIEIRKRTGEKS